MSKRPANLRPIFTGPYNWLEGFSGEKLRGDWNGPAYHGGKPVDCIIKGWVPKEKQIRPVWKDDYGSFRMGRTGDMVQMFVDLGVSDRAF